MSDQGLRVLERQAISTRDIATNEALKRTQQRAGMTPVGITNIGERPDAYILKDLLHDGTFYTIAWSKNRIPSHGLAAADQLITETKGGFIERALGLFRKRQTWELPSTKLIYSTIVALNVLCNNEATATLASQLREQIANNLIGAIASFVTSTSITYQTGEQDTIIHRYGTKAQQKITLPLKEPSGQILLNQNGERTQAILLALFGTTDARAIQEELRRLTGGMVLPHITLSTATIQEAPHTCQITLSLNRRSSHGKIALAINARPIILNNIRMPVQGHSIPVQYL